jgi:ribokinase
VGGPTILSLGSINADLRFEVERPFSGGGTVRSSGFSQKGGGKAANVAYFTHRLGIPTKLLGQVGDDDFAAVALGSLMQAGLDLSAVVVASNSLTGVAVVAVPADGNKSILSAPNANMDWQAPAIEKIVRAIEGAASDSVLIADFEVPRIVLEAAFDAAEERDLRIVVDPTFADQVKRTELSRFCAISPNQDEAADILGVKIAGEADAAAAAIEFNALGAEIACVRLSDGGCVLNEGEDTTILRAPAVDVVDKTGAGDAFIAALGVALLERRSPYEAACWGVAAASFSVGRKGTQESYPTRSEFDRMLAAVLKKNGRPAA